MMSQMKKIMMMLMTMTYMKMMMKIRAHTCRRAGA